MRRISSGQQQCSEKQCCCQWTETDQWSASRKKVCFSFKEYDSFPFTPGPPNHDSNFWPSLVRRPLMCNVQERERERERERWCLLAIETTLVVLEYLHRDTSGMRPAMERMYLHDTPGPRPLSHPMYQGFVTALSSPAHAMPVLCYLIFPALRPIKPLLLCW
jgi:hypothetical protein